MTKDEAIAEESAAEKSTIGGGAAAERSSSLGDASRSSKDDGAAAAAGAGEREAGAKEFRGVLAAKKEVEMEYDPDKEYVIPKAKTIVTLGTLKKGVDKTVSKKIVKWCLKLPRLKVFSAMKSKNKKLFMSKFSTYLDIVKINKILH